MNDHYLTAEELNKTNTYATQSEIIFLRQEMPGLLPEFARVVMIGAGPGVMLLSLLDNEKAAKWEVYVIDLVSVKYAQEHMRRAKPFISDMVDKVIWMEGVRSHIVGHEFAVDGNIDLLIVDGDHTETGIRLDMETWLPIVAENGYVLFHDYDYKGTEWEDKPREDYPEVKLFVDAEMNRPVWNFRPILKIGCSSIFKRYGFDGRE